MDHMYIADTNYYAELNELHSGQRFHEEGKDNQTEESPWGKTY